MFWSRHKRAFTLIELLVAVTILALLFSLALASYIRYSEKQEVVAAAEIIEAELKVAQNRSKTGYLGACDELASNDFRLWTNNNNRLYYRHSVTCVDGNSYDETSIAVAENIALTNELYLSFVPYGAATLRIMGSADAYDELNTLLSSLRRADYQVSFTLDKGGGIQVEY